jgi:hypothetical protein
MSQKQADAFSRHSVRVGARLDLLALNKAAMQAGRRKSSQMLTRYRENIGASWNAIFGAASMQGCDGTNC